MRRVPRIFLWFVHPLAIFVWITLIIAMNNLRASDTHWTIHYAGARTFNIAWWTLVVLLMASLLRTLIFVFACLFRLADYGTRRARLNQPLCPTCRYDLRGLPSNVCPECGAGFLSDEPRG